MKKTARQIAFAGMDFVVICCSWVLAVLLSESDLSACLSVWWFPVTAAAVCLVLNGALGLYRKMWRYVGATDIMLIFVSCGTMSVLFVVTAVIETSYTLSWCVICSLLYDILLFVSRLSLKILYVLEHSVKSEISDKNAPVSRVILIGAGDAANLLINDVRSNLEGVEIVCALDDDPKKIGREINGINVVGNTDQAEKFAKKYDADKIIIAMPSVGRKKLKEIILKCRDTKCKIQTLPAVYSLVTGDVSIKDVKDVNIADLLGRDQIKVNIDEILRFIENKKVMVTGGGGSIGSELCRQIASHGPERLIIVDIYENNAYEIQQELIRSYPELDLVVRIASVRDGDKMDRLFEEFKPNIVFHAAAHKHVPLMEDAPDEAVKNNVGGTYNVADAAGRFGTEKFVLISTDKAVNPTNVMGATKRVCEMIIQAMDKKYPTDYVAVRFGNVLGSNGSVVPLFKQQIAEGGPITLTHKDIVRYFMTIPEAVSLVLQAGAYASGGEIFVLDMGEPVRIYDLAVNLIKLSGLEPYKDIDIKIVGLRPGEKLYEERLMDEEGLQKTANDMISIGKPIEFDVADFLEKVRKMCEIAHDRPEDMKEFVKSVVSTYVAEK